MDLNVLSADSGPLMLQIDAALVLTTVAIVLLIGHFLLRIPFVCRAWLPSDRQSARSWSMRRYGADRSSEHRPRHDVRRS
jgi:hypothetical protein